MRIHLAWVPPFLLILTAVPTSAGSIESVLFTEGGAFAATNTFKSALLSFIAGANSTIDVAIYNLRDADVIAALNTAATGGKTVRVVTDADNNGTGHPIKTLSSSITVRDDGSIPGIMHHKFVVIDAAASNAAVWTGSANFTSPSFSSQNNNALIIRDANVAAAYKTEFDRLFVSNQFHQTKSLSQTTFTLSDGSSIEIRFSPGMSVQSAYAGLVTGASASFYYAIFTFGSSTIANAMISRASLSDFGYFEKAQVDLGFTSQFTPIEATSGMAVQLDANPFEMHHKFLVVDGKTVATGSYNFTVAGDQANDENVVIIRNNTALAAKYIQEINRITGQNLEALGANIVADTSTSSSSPSSSSPSSSSSSSSSGVAAILSGPNPVRIGSDEIRFRASNTSAIQRVDIFDLYGRLVHVITGPAALSTSDFAWNGRNTRGELVAPGVYVYVVTAGSKTFSGRITAVH